MIWDRQDAVLVAGAPDERLLAVLNDEIAADARKRWIPELCMFFDHPDWPRLLTSQAGSLRIKPAQRRYYKFQELRLTWHEFLPEKFAMRRIDPFLLQNEKMLNSALVAGWVNSFWATPEDFSRSGFGYCVIDDDTIAAWCLTVFASKDQRELGLATMPEYQRLGLASATASACLSHCLTQNLTPHWHCWEDNIPSQKVAEKVGFGGPVMYEVMRIGL